MFCQALINFSQKWMSNGNMGSIKDGCEHEVEVGRNARPSIQANKRTQIVMQGKLMYDGKTFGMFETFALQKAKLANKIIQITKFRSPFGNLE